MSPAEILALLKAGRKFWTLILVAVMAAGCWYWMERAKADRAQLLADAREICEAAGAPYQPEGSKQRQWGDACLGRVRHLGQLDLELATANADALIAAMRERAGKETADAALAAAMSARTNETLKRMEAADAAIENDRVGPGWAAAVNELGGLRH